MNWIAMGLATLTATRFVLWCKLKKQESDKTEY